MRPLAFLLLIVCWLGMAAPAQAEPAFGANCLSCHSQLQTNKIVVLNEDTTADPDESGTGAPDRGTLPVFQAMRGQVKSLEARVQNLSADDTYAVQLSRFRYRGVVSGGTLYYEGDCVWPEWGENVVYYTNEIVAASWETGPVDLAFDIYVDSGVAPDYYDLMFAVAGKFDGDDGLFCGYQHFYLQVLSARVGDLDGDGDVDDVDLDLFVPVLLGTDSTLVARADMNGDSSADGRDIALFVDAFIRGGGH
jgi:hypothetical protein